MEIHSPVNIEQRKKLDIRAGDTVRVWQKITERIYSESQNSTESTESAPVKDEEEVQFEEVK